MKRKKVNVGTRLKNSFGDVLECVGISGLLYELKYVRENGSLSEGSVIIVPSHFGMYKII